MTAAPLKTFIIYARADAAFKNELLLHLHPFVENKLIEKWVDSDLLPGEDWEKRIEQELEAAHLVIMLVSAHALSSEFIRKKELKTAIEKKRAGSARVVPVLVRDCMWKLNPDIAELQLLPRGDNGRIQGVAAWLSRDSAWTNVCEELYPLIQEIRAHLEKEQAERVRRRRDETFWKKISEGTALSDDPQRQIELYESYLQEEAFSLYRAEAEDAIEAIQTEIEAAARVEAARRAAEEKCREKSAQPFIEMVSVEGGPFLLSGKHLVTMPDFEIGKYPVTQKQWQEIMGNNPSRFKRDDLPVESVSWDDTKAFITKLNERFPGRHFRLPSEAEWEYAARGGRPSKGYEYAGSNQLDEVGWYDKNSGEKTHPVGLKKANELGIHDMSGNVWEWCEDDWHRSYKGVPADSSAWVNQPKRGAHRVLRGGCWYVIASRCHVSNRGYSAPDNCNLDIGFRIASSLRR